MSDNRSMSKDSTGVIAKLSQQCVQDSLDWFPNVGTEEIPAIPHHTLALCGEAGELANLVKKIQRGSLDSGNAAVRLDLAMELTDVLIYVLNIAGILKIDLEVTYKMKRAENVKRFGGGKSVKFAVDH